MAISDRLREINLYKGLVFDDLNGEELMTLLDHRERRTRGEYGTTYLTTFPTLAKGPTAGTFELTVGDFLGVSNRRPVFQDGTVNVPLEEAGDGTIQGPTTVVGGPGFSRLIVLTAEWVGLQYDPKTDDNGAAVNAKVDEGVAYRVFMGAESNTTPPLPIADLQAAFTATGAIPIAVVQRDFSETEIDPDKITPYETFVQGVQDVVTGVRAMFASMLSNVPAAWIRQVPLQTHTVTEDSLRKLDMGTAVGAAGGFVAMDSNPNIFAIGIDGRVRWFVPATLAYITPDLDVSSRYFLRVQISDDGYDRLVFYVQKGTLPATDGDTYDATPVSLRGTPNAASGGGFPSTSRDLLLGIIDTGLAGTMPTYTPLYSGDFTYTFDVSYGTSPLIVPMTLTTPFSCDYDVRVEFDENNFAPAPPAVNHRDFKPLGSRVTFYSYTQVEIEAQGRWLEDNGAGLLRIPAADEIARPGYRVIIRPKYRNL